MILPLVCAGIGGLILGGWLMATAATTALSHYSSWVQKRERSWREESTRTTFINPEQQ